MAGGSWALASQRLFFVFFVFDERGAASFFCLFAKRGSASFVFISNSMPRGRNADYYFHNSHGRGLLGLSQSAVVFFCVFDERGTASFCVLFVCKAVLR